MDKNVTVKLFRMTRANDAVPRFIEVLNTIFAIPEVEDREKSISANFEIRLEHLEHENTHIVCGELTRIQTTNYPSELTRGARRALNIQNRLGHSIVFRANHHLGLLGIEYNNRVCSPGRLFSYMLEFDADAQYNVVPLVREDVWERYNRAGPRKVQIAVAAPTDLTVLQGQAEAAGRAFAAMGDAYAAPKITIEISMGHARGQLGHRIGGLIEGLLGSSAREQIKLQKLKVYNAEEQDGVDFIQELVTFKETLELHDRDPNVNFRIKRDYIRRVMHGLA